MKKRTLLLLCFFFFVAISAVACGQKDDSSLTLQDIPASRIDSQSTVVRDGKRYTYAKYKDENGVAKSGVFDEEGKPVDPSILQQPPANPIGGDLESILKDAPADLQGQKIRVVVELKDDVPRPEEPPASGGTNEHLTQEERDRLDKAKEDAEKKYNEARKEKRKELLAKLIADNSLSIEQDMQDAYIRGDGLLVIELPVKDVKEFLEKNKAIIRHMEKKPEVATTSAA